MDFSYLANIDWTQTGSVVLVGLVVVFAALIILVLICMLLGKIFSSISKSGGNASKKEEKAPAKTQTPPAVKQAVAPKAENGVSEEVVAAITAAIAAMMGPDKPFVLRSVKRAKTGRSAWNAAGIAENTRPF